MVKKLGKPDQLRACHEAGPQGATDGTSKQHALTAVARELLGFIGAIGVEAERIGEDKDSQPATLPRIPPAGEPCLRSHGRIRHLADDPIHVRRSSQQHLAHASFLVFLSFRMVTNIQHFNLSLIYVRRIALSLIA